MVKLRTTIVYLVLILALGGHTALAANNIFFLHHSTGRNLIEEGSVRNAVETYNAARGSAVVFWDHDYNYIGLRNPAGAYLGYNYNIPDDNTYPDGLHVLWTTNNAARTAILENHQVIAFKSCFPTCDIDSDAELQQYKDWYLDMRDVFDQHPTKTFVVISPPPRHRLATNAAAATRARAFATWMGSAEYMSGHGNLRFYDLFDRMAHADDGSGQANCLRYEYERSHSSTDSHPNVYANQSEAPEFIQFLLDTAAETTPNHAMSWGDVKSTFR
ncbi:hypothetical protein H8E07_09770 [bacterium]|nr:hypothetical protein [bacterium]